METWGRISALSALTRHIDFSNLLDEFNTMDITEAWQGIASIWTHPENIKRHREQCLAGIEAALKVDNPHAAAVARHIDNIFRDNTPSIPIPIELIQLCFSVFENDSDHKYHRLFEFNEWLNAISQRDQELTLTATEIYLAYVSQTKPYFYDHKIYLFS